jgi:threonine/homoserine/homoserine lactone efflux protein
MEMTFLLRGMVIGFSIAAPVGPIGILCIRRSLAKGRLSGFVTGMGAASADTVYGIFAAFGLTLVTSVLVEYRLWLQAAGLVFLLYLGVKTFLAKPGDAQEETPKPGGLLRDYISTFFLTITNPMTILSFTAVFAGIGLAGTSGYAAASLIVFGVFLGSALWWLILSTGAGIFRKKAQATILGWVNKISGTIILGFGIFILAALIRTALG